MRNIVCCRSPNLGNFDHEDCRLILNMTIALCVLSAGMCLQFINLFGISKFRNIYLALSTENTNSTFDNYKLSKTVQKLHRTVPGIHSIQNPVKNSLHSWKYSGLFSSNTLQKILILKDLARKYLIWQKLPRA